jgi:hypothetical protein
VIVVRLLAVMTGVVMVVRTLLSALRTVVVPRAENAWLTRVHFVTWRRLFVKLARPSRPFAARDRVMSLYAPLGLVTLPAVWLVFIIVGFWGIFWGFDAAPVGESLVLSGSSVTTLGFARPESQWLSTVAVVEAGIGLGLVGLMISYLPTIYGAFSRREALVGMLEVRAGLPPSPAELFVRYSLIGRLDQLAEDLFVPWEQWFVDIEESHTSQPALVFFRSPHPERSWVTAAGCVLDSAALHAALIDAPHDARADVMLRSGYLSLRRIADYFELEYEPDPHPDDPISITRREFDLAVVELRAAGVPLKDDLDRAWTYFAGWRVNYDQVLVQLAAFTIAPPGRWSSDRALDVEHRSSVALPTWRALRRHAERRRHDSGSDTDSDTRSDTRSDTDTDTRSGTDSGP